MLEFAVMEDNSKMSTVKGRRSPNYPAQTLREAIDTIRRVYAAQHTYPQDREVVAQNLGYKGLNGASLTVIGTLKRYGLLEMEGEQVKVSDDAVAILELPEDHPDRIDALQRAAYTTTLFADIRETYGDKLPSDVVLRHDLIKRKFLPKAADEVIRIYRDNLELVTSQTPEYTEDDTIVEQGFEGRSSMPQSQPQYTQPSSFKDTAGRQRTQPGKRAFEFSFPLSFQRDVTAVITIYADEIKRRDLDNLKKQVENLLDSFEDEVTEPPQYQEPPTRAELVQAKGTGSLEVEPIAGGENGTLDT